MSDCHCLTLLCTVLGDYCKFPVSLALAIIIITFLRSCLIFRKVKHHSKRRPSAMPYTRRSEEQFLRGVSFKEILWAPAPRDNSYTYRRCLRLFKRLRHKYVYFVHGEELHRELCSRLLNGLLSNILTSWRFRTRVGIRLGICIHRFRIQGLSVDENISDFIPSPRSLHSRRGKLDQWISNILTEN